MTLQADFISQNELVAARRATLKGLYDDANKLTGVKRTDLTETITTANRELNDLVDEQVRLQELVEGERRNAEAMKAMSRPVNRQVEPETDEAPKADETFDDPEAPIIANSVKSLLRTVMTSTGMKAGGEGFKRFRGPLGLVGYKTLITSADLSPQGQRLSQIFPSAQEERTVADLMLQGTTSAQSIQYYEETTFTNAAVETAEGAAKQESALDFTLREDFVRKIATWVPVTDEMLADVPAFESYLRERLGFMVKLREEAALLTGTGVGQAIQGIHNRTGVQTVTGYGDTTIDSIYHGITLVRAVAFAEPTAIVAHPYDWENVRLSKDTTGNYLLGPANTEGDNRVWGLQVRITTAEPENTLLVGAFRPHAQIFRRSGIEIAISTENEDYFLKNKVAVRAEERLALAVYRPSAFAKVEAIVEGS